MEDFYDDDNEPMGFHKIQEISLVDEKFLTFIKGMYSTKLVKLFNCIT